MVFYKPIVTSTSDLKEFSANNILQGFRDYKFDSFLSFKGKISDSKSENENTDRPHANETPNSGNLQQIDENWRQMQYGFQIFHTGKKLEKTPLLMNVGPKQR